MSCHLKYFTALLLLIGTVNLNIHSNDTYDDSFVIFAIEKLFVYKRQGSTSAITVYTVWCNHYCLLFFAPAPVATAYMSLMVVY